MIDTITLRLNEKDFKILDHNAFTPNTYNFYYPPYSRFGARGYIEAYNNPTQADYKNRIYKPQLTLRKKMVNALPLIYLYIQFSAPKIVFLNNFDELRNEDIENVVEKLSDSLRKMSVEVSSDVLKKALVCKVHFSKNIPLPEYVIPYFITKEVSKTDLSLRYDLTEKDYRNKGDSIRFHTNSFEVILYDKKKDLQKGRISDSRSIEKGNAIQFNIFDSINSQKKFEILRIEVRYNSIQKIRSVFKRDFNLVQVCDSDISLSVLRSVWNDIVSNYNLLNCSIDNKELFFRELVSNNPDIKLNNLLSIYGFIEYCKTFGVREFRKIIESVYSSRSWYGIKYKMNSINIVEDNLECFEFISNYLKTYKPLDLKSYTDTINVGGNNL
ncbi:hypothetical protein CVU76_02375 [Candidatus Dojkabacteria bacterium HGW-Dojkabacteria-1]|uniref:Uncharacterized protein n=1 Tax=Candidatus Dojkabacteria bacterium HGW-Dojkabacteria-1 TaxID=2013761 RepID=A0A2N2F3U4_9BACT|nr:MAG: hypothetical protein CVU76_02375 [Candidatus Dojkabacteria bacterium HGW-Dojkabacteria-1]